MKNLQHLISLARRGRLVLPGFDNAACQWTRNPSEFYLLAPRGQGRYITSVRQAPEDERTGTTPRGQSPGLLWNTTLCPILNRISTNCDNQIEGEGVMKRSPTSRSGDSY